MAARQEQRIATEASSRSLTCRMPSSTERSGSRSTWYSCQNAGFPDSAGVMREAGLVAPPAFTYLEEAGELPS